MEIVELEFVANFEREEKIELNRLNSIIEYDKRYRFQGFKMIYSTPRSIDVSSNAFFHLSKD